jgi:hypothetical protein
MLYFNNKKKAFSIIFFLKRLHIIFLLKRNTFVFLLKEKIISVRYPFYLIRNEKIQHELELKDSNKLSSLRKI